MKTYEEMAEYVLEVRDEYEKKRKRRIIAAKRIVPAVAGVCCTMAIVFGIWKGHVKPDEFLLTNDITIDATTTAAVTTTLHTTDNVTAYTTSVTTGGRKNTYTTLPASFVAATSAMPATAESKTTAAHVTSETTAVIIKTTTSEQYISATTTSKVTTVSKTTSVTTVTTQGTPSGAASGELTAGGTGGYDGEGGFGGGGVIIGGGSGGEGGSIGGSSSGGEGMGGGAIGGGGGWGGAVSWSSLPVNERYDTALLDGYTDVYTNTFRISPDDVGDRIGDAVMEGYDYSAGEYHRCTADVYYIKNIRDSMAVAVRFEGNEYYLYRNRNTDIERIFLLISPME